MIENTARIWEGLNTGKADGRACVICGRDYLSDRRGPARRVPVGRAVSTRSQVFACVGECATRASVRCYPGGAMALSGRALATATIAFHRALITTDATVSGGPFWVSEAMTSVIAAAAPLVIAAELRSLATTLEDRAETLRPLWPQIVTTPPELVLDEAAETARYETLLECARLTRVHALSMDPTGGPS